MPVFKQKVVMGKQTLTGNPEIVDPGFTSPPGSPLSLLQKWLTMAEELQIVEPYALILSTVNTDGQPSSRVVLLKEVDDTGVLFATSEASKKGRDIASTKVVAGALWWPQTMQQVNFSGTAKPCSSSISDKMFAERTREAQAVAAISQQSAIMRDEEALRTAVTTLVQSHARIERPVTWHAYHITIETIEFWHGSTDRFHNRLYYYQHQAGWRYHKLQP
ncbi:MAG: pyridoxal 5'-phosphate synthase [Proteobacteria bacterium]|nr:pyridoxal 5'-phosphate synthase [Pseudomonadota bacterium]